MRLGVVTQPPFNQLPHHLLTHLVNHSPDVFYRKSRPYTKLNLPPSYTENQALCQQFGISPHSILCMEPALWRQQIVQQVIFDLSESLVQIDFINGSRAVYSFKKSQEEETRHHTTPHQQERSTTFSSSCDPPVCEKLTTALTSHLRSLHSFHQRGAQFVADLNQLSKLSSQQLAVLMKKLGPYPLTPTPRQVALDERRARQRIGIPVLIKKKPARRRRSSSLGTPRQRHQIKSTPAAAPTNTSPSHHPPFAQLTSTFSLPDEDLYHCILHLTRYRSTLVDLFQSVVLALLRVELPELYPLWILQSQIRSLQDNFKLCATELVQILYDNDTLNLFQRLHSSEQELDSLCELKLWCEAANASTSSSHNTSFNGEPMGQDTSSFSQLFNSETPELLFSGNTSFNEPSSSQLGDQSFRSESSIHLQNPAVFSSSILPGKGTSKSENDVSQHFPTTLPWPGLPSSTNTTEHGLLDNPQSSVKRSDQTHTPSFDGLCRSNQSNIETPIIYHVPLLLLEQELLETIRSEEEKKRGVELVIKLAEARLLMEKLEENSRIIKLLEEERRSREEFSGISRLSDIITTSRLSCGGMEGCEGEIGRHVRIKAALKKVHEQQTSSSSLHQLNSSHLRDRGAPSKASEMRRQQAIKRRAWLATTRRLDRPWIHQVDHQLVNNHNNNHQTFNSVWPEPIFLKPSSRNNLKRKRQQDDLQSSNRNSPSSTSTTPPVLVIDQLTSSPKLVDPSFIPILPTTPATITSTSMTSTTTTSTSSFNNSHKSSHQSIGDLRKILLNL